jgi:hypothetical protein
MMKKVLFSGALAACMFAAACGGGGSSGSSSGSGSGSGSSGGSGGQSVAVAGPLDTVQTTLSSSVLSPLEGATSGTPLQGVLVCTDDIVDHNTLDILDVVLNALQNPTSASAAPAQVQALVSEMVNNLGSLLTSLASSSGGCGSGAGGGTGTGVPTTNPLAGTPLAPLGDALLPVLQQLQSQTGSGSGSSAGGLQQLATLVDQLNVALQTGLSQVPASAKSQPVVGGVLTTLGTTVANLSSMMDAVGANNSSAFQSSTQTMLDNLLVNVLTQVVPTAYLETQAGQPGVVTGPIKTAAGTFSSTVATALGQGESQLLAALNSSQLAPVVNPVLNTLLPAILGPINQALAGAGGSSSGGSSGGVTGTPLDAVLGPLTTVLKSVLGGVGGSSSGGTSACVLAGTPLSVLCTLIP